MKLQNMMRGTLKFIMILGLVVIGFLAVSCSRQSQNKLGKKARIVSLSPALTEIVLHLQGGNDLVGVDRFSLAMLKKKAKCYENLPVVGSMGDLNIEKILVSKPTVVLAQSFNKQDRAALSKLGNTAKVEQFKISTLDDIRSSVLRVGKIIGKTGNAGKYVKHFDKQIDSLRGQVTGKPAVLFISADFGLLVPAEGNYIDDLITIAGARNCGRDLKSKRSWVSVTAEKLATLNPDIVIIHNTKGKPMLTSVWMKAIQNRKAQASKPAPIVKTVSDPNWIVPGANIVGIIPQLRAIFADYQAMATINKMKCK